MTKSEAIRNVAVYLGSVESPVPEFRQAAIDLADYLARHGMTLIFGGSNTGMMKILADAMLQRNGRVIGIFTRCLPEKLLRNDLTESIVTETLAERKAEMLKRADAVVALPGSIGTLDELFDALAQRKIGAIRCPIGVLNANGFFDPLFALLRNSVEAGFTSSWASSLLRCGGTPEELFRELNNCTKSPTWDDKLILEAAFIRDYEFMIRFKDQRLKLVDIEPYINRHRKMFYPIISNQDLLKDFHYDSIELYWDDIMGIEAQTLYDMGKDID